jgi:hypothetical protein
MNPTAIYSKTGKGVQEASGKTSQLSRGDRAILSAIDGKISLKDLGAKFDRPADDKFFALIKKLDADGFIREVSPGTVQRGAANAPKPAAKAAPAAGGGGGGGEELDFTQIFSAPPKQEKPPASSAPAGKDPMVAAREAAEARARAEREAKARAEAIAKAAPDGAQKERLDVEARAKAAREATMAAAAEGKTRAQMEAEKRAAEEAKARAERDAREAAERAVRQKAEAERQAQERAERERIEAERSAKERAERELREKAEAADRGRFEAAERARREAEDLRRKVEEERRAREEAERRAREEAERTKREAEERSRREAEERKAREEADALRKKLEEERAAREEAERRAQEERDKREHQRLAELKKIQEEEEAARKAREEQDRREEAENQRQIRLAREAEDKKRRDADARKKKEAEAKRWEQEEARRKSDDSYRQRAEQEDKERAEREAVESVERAEADKKAAEAADALAGSLLADLDSFSARQDEEKKEKEEEERKARVEAEKRARQEAEQREREEAERKQRKEEERRRKDEEERRAKEEEERQAKEEAERKKEEAEKKKREREEQARQKAAPAGEVPISNADMDRGAVSDDERKLSPEARKALRDREREVARARNRGDQGTGSAAAAYKRKQPINWGKPVAIALFFLLVGGVGVVNFMPLSTAEYEKLASDAVGVPVKIGAARMYALAGVQMRFERVSIGDAVKIAAVRAVPEFDTLLGEDKVFSRLELDGVVLQQEALAELLQGGMKGRRLRVARLVGKEARLDGPLPLPAMDFDASVGSDGKVSSVKLSGDRVNGLLTPKGAEIAFDVSLGSFAVPFLGKLSLADFGMKGVANRQGMAVNEFTGRLYDGTMAGNARIQWGAQWTVQGQIEGRSMNAAVFSPQLVSEGRFDGKGRYTMSGPDPLKLHESARLDGGFTVAKGALGSFDLARALQSSSAQASGRTPFTELQGQVSLAGGALALRDLELNAGLLKASGALDVDPKGALAGRINAELRTLRGQLYIGGSLTDPQLRR